MVDNYLFCNFSGVICSGHGECVDKGLETATCKCGSLYDSQSNCSSTLFKVWGGQMIALPVVGLLLYVILLALTIIEFIPELTLRNWKSFKPFAVAKLLLILTIIGLILECVWELINGVQGHKELVYPQLQTAATIIYGVLLMLYLTMVFLSWIEIIERARKLDRVKWTGHLRIATCVILAVILLVNFIALPLAFAVVDINPTAAVILIALPILLDAFYLIYLFIISICAVVRGRKWWALTSHQKGRLVTRARTKVKWFIASLATLALFPIIVVVEAVVPVSYGSKFAMRAIWDVELFSLLGITFVFIQRHVLFKARAFIWGIQASASSHEKTTTTSSNSPTSPTSPTSPRRLETLGSTVARENAVKDSSAACEESDVPREVAPRVDMHIKTISKSMTKQTHEEVEDVESVSSENSTISVSDSS
jgi:hypothetical protein